MPAGGALVGSVAAYAVVGTLLAAGAGHLAAPGLLPRALATHGRLPAPATVAFLVTAAECLLGGAGAVAGVRADTGGLRTALAGAAVLLALLGAYAWRVARRGPGGPCGCSRRQLPMTTWVAVRAGALAALALAGLALAGSVVPPGRPGTDLVVVLLAAAALGWLLWLLPAAMHDPARAGRPPATAGVGRR
jgi:hypothetical protein